MSVWKEAHLLGTSAELRLQQFARCKHRQLEAHEFPLHHDLHLLDAHGAVRSVVPRWSSHIDRFIANGDIVFTMTSRITLQKPLEVGLLVTVGS